MENGEDKKAYTEALEKAIKADKVKREYVESQIEAQRRTPYERARAAVYATGNRWAIENWNATH
jgi:hypothetical protein